MNITSFLNSKGFYHFEGYSQECKEQVEDLIKLTKNPNINIMEIGFNAGHSAEVFLENNKELTLTSFDIGSHDYLASAKEYIDVKYPNKHTLMLGDSKITVPNYIENNKGIKFDFIFIDGAHGYDDAKIDMENCFHLAHKDTIVVLDDTVFTKEFESCHTCGPTSVWLEYLQQNKIIELGRKEYYPGRGMSWGKYLF